VCCDECGVEADVQARGWRPLVCEECGAVTTDDAQGWQAYLAGGLEGEEDEQPSAYLFCPVFVEREFD
jgi:hypothetical protein